MTMQVVVQRGNQFIVTEQDPNDADSEGFIIDIDQKLKSESLSIQRILKWGYWEEPKDIQNKILLKIRKIYG